MGIRVHCRFMVLLSFCFGWFSERGCDMTREEAINLLGWLTSKTNREDDLEAIDMAIEALQNNGFCPNCGVVVRCKDCKHKVTTKDGEYNPEDIVCDYWMSDGLEETDFCSYGERKGGGAE